MFILDNNKFDDFDLTNTKEFIEFWSKYYSDSIRIFDRKDKISYIDELNLKNDLTSENLRRLLRWKDQLRLTEKTGIEKKDNPKVLHVLENLNSINYFRSGKIGHNEFNKITEKIFPEGFVWRIFLFHIALPYKYPIADRYVFRTFSTLTKQKEPKDCDGYKEYKKFFFDIAKFAEINQENKNDTSDIVSRLKKVDNALLTFGQFLDKYHSQSEDK